MKYIKSFENHTEYETFTGTTEFILPNVSLCKQENEVHYNPYVEPVETRVVAKFNVTDTSNPTPISFKKSYYDGTSGFSSIEIDGVEQPSVVSAYTFNTTGEHIVKYTLKNPTSIGNSAFTDCTNLTSIYIPNSVTSIGTKAFDFCIGLASINIPDNVTYIGESAFSQCYFTSIDIPDSVTSIGNFAFNSCEYLTSINIPDSVTTIGRYAFTWCRNMTTCVIGNGVTSIGQYAFERCTGLTTCTIGSGVTSIGNQSFSGCKNLTSITVNAATPPTFGSFAFNDTNNCPIYVPSESVETYKTASGWSDLASRIQAIA